MNLNFRDVNSKEYIDIKEHIQSNRYRKKRLPLSVIEKYDIEPIFRNPEKPNLLCDKAMKWMYGRNPSGLIYNLFMRGSVGIVLTYEESPQALLSFDFFNTFMRIYQNKGIKPILYFDQDADYFSDSVGLRQIKSNTKLMYDIAIDIAGKMELEKVEIISAKNRPDFNSGLLDDRLMWQIFKTCDVLPFDMGFEEKDDGNWVKYFNESELFFKSLKN